MPASILFFRIYKSLISPILAVFFFPYGQCRFYPSCSEYTEGSVKKYGVMKGARLGALRVLRCNPWSSGGLDLVP